MSSYKDLLNDKEFLVKLHNELKQTKRKIEEERIERYQKFKDEVSDYCRIPYWLSFITMIFLIGLSFIISDSPFSSYTICCAFLAVTINIFITFFYCQCN